MFGYNSAKLTNEGKEYLDKFLKVYADLVTGENFEGKISAIKIEGHTDTIGTYEYKSSLAVCEDCLIFLATIIHLCVNEATVHYKSVA